LDAHWLADVPWRNAKVFTAGPTHTCAVVHNDSSVRCWGFRLNDNWVLGVTNNPVYIPVGVSSQPILPLAFVASGPNLRTVMVASYSGLHTCAIVGNGAVRCWGTNAFGQVRCSRGSCGHNDVM
jgi:hypothetical protein